ncbi:MAG: type II toxin-antitoxin system VapC family toxin [Pseudomonadota bacterium]
MIILDTNVVSEVMRDSPDPRVMLWFGQQSTGSLFITATTEAELKKGVAFLPEGRRRLSLTRAVQDMIVRDFRNRILPFDSSATDAYARISANRRLSGRPISEADCMIASIAQYRGALLATRNTADFVGCGVDLIDPWKTS